MTALFELADGGAMRTNEFRRVGYWNGHESRFRFYGTEQVFEQSGHGATLSVKTEGDGLRQGRDPRHQRSVLHRHEADAGGLRRRRPGAACRASPPAPPRCRTARRLPKEFEGAHNGHEGSHHFLADDFVRAVDHARRTRR